MKEKIKTHKTFLNDFDHVLDTISNILYDVLLMENGK